VGGSGSTAARGEGLTAAAQQVQRDDRDGIRL
jgi:hypothetical protein